jgi:hypothetical protein
VRLCKENPEIHREGGERWTTVATTVSIGITEDWRVGPEDQPLTAVRCRCPRPLLDTDADGWTLCVPCGREPAIRLPAPLRAAESAPNGSNGVVAGDPTPELVRKSRNGDWPAPVAPPVQVKRARCLKKDERPVKAEAARLVS